MIVPNPWALLVAVGVVAGAYATGRWDQHRMEQGQMLAAERLAREAGEQATAAAVDAIKELRPQFTTIKQETIRETHIEPRYIAGDCSHTDPIWLQLQAAYAAAGGSLGGGAGLSGPAVPGGPDARRDDGRTH